MAEEQAIAGAEPVSESADFAGVEMPGVGKGAKRRFRRPVAGAPYVIVCDADEREEWLRARLTGVGASEIAAVLGESSWDTPLSLYLRKAEPLPDDVAEDEKPEWVELGLILEPVIRDEVARRAGVKLYAKKKQRLLRSTEHTWALATLDAITTEGEPVEVKNLSHGYDAEEWAEGIPRKYLLQCQQQMMVTGARRVLFGALVWGNRIVWEWVERDEAIIRQIIAAGAAFWLRVLNRDAPQSMGTKMDRKALSARVRFDVPMDEWPEIFEGDIARELERFELAKAAAKAANDAAKAAEAELDAAKDALALVLGDQQRAATASGWRLEWSESERRGYTVQPAKVRKFSVTREGEKKGRKAK